MKLRLRPYEPQIDDEAWDGVVARSINGTFLHTRRFLAYHGDRFADRSLVVEDEGHTARAVLPAALDRADAEIVVSHPGITFGGLIHDGTLAAEDVITVLEAAADVHREGGARLFRYKAVPAVFHRAPASEDVYALFRIGATRSRCDLSATIDLAQRRPLAHGRISCARTAERRGVEARWGWDAGPEFWAMLCEVLGERHGAKPVHTLEEIQHLVSLFPEVIGLVTSWMDGQMVGGGVTFLMPPVVHLQYSATSSVGRKVGACDVMVEAGVSAAVASGQRYYDFGISTENEGRVLNGSLHNFKTSFGAGATIFEHYEVTL